MRFGRLGFPSWTLVTGITVITGCPLYQGCKVLKITAKCTGNNNYPCLKTFLGNGSAVEIAFHIRGLMRHELIMWH